MDLYNIFELKSANTQRSLKLSSCSNAVQEVVEELNNLLDDSLQQTQDYNSRVKIKIEDEFPILDENPQMLIKNENGIMQTKEQLCITTEEMGHYGNNLDTKSNLPNLAFKSEYSNIEFFHNNPQVIQDCYIKLTRLPYNLNKESKPDDFIFCFLCNYKTLEKRSLKDHMRYNHQGRKHFMCDKCSYTSPYKQKYLLHVKRVHDKEPSRQPPRPHDPFSCNECDFKSQYKHFLNRHVNLVHNKLKPYVCDVCSSAFRYNYELKRHKLIKHEGVNNTFSCNMCQFSTAYKSCLKNHLMRHTGEKVFGCNVCDFHTATKSYLRLHMRVHTGEKPFNCELCNYRAAHKHILQEHVKKHSNQKLFACELCAFNSSNKVGLQKHIRKHNQEKPFKCTICNFETRYNSHLKLHMNNHMGEKRHTCNKCEYRTVYKSNLNLHMKTHETVKPFLCSLCYYSTCSKHDLLKHIAVHSGNKPFSCKVCNFRTAYKNSLKDHMKTHKDRKPLGCPQSGFCTNEKRSIKKHDGMRIKSKNLFTCYECNMTTSWKTALAKHMNVHRKNNQRLINKNV